jgi:hypothetical protein
LTVHRTASPKNSFCDFQFHFSWSAAPAVKKSNQVIRNAAQQGKECHCLQFGTFFIYCLLHVAKANAMKANLPMKIMKKMPAMKTKKGVGL